MKKFLTADTIILSGLFIAFSVLMTLMYHYTPFGLDEYLFMSVYIDNGGGTDFNPDAWLEYISCIREGDNSRIANILVPLFSMIEPWRSIFNVLTGLLCGSIALMVLHFCGLRNNRGLGFALVWMLMVIALPWRNSIMLMDYALNYIYSSFVTLLFLVFMLGSRGWGRWGMVGMLPLTVIAGGFHEGFSLTVLLGLGVYIILNKWHLPLGWWAIFTVYAVSSAAFALSPGILGRFENELVVESALAAKATRMRDLWLVIATSLVLIAFCFRRGLREIWTDKTLTVFIVMMAVGTGICFLVRFSPRTAFWPQLCAAVVALRLFKNVISAFRRRSASVLALFIAAVMTVQNVHAISWAKRLYEQNEQIMTILFQGEDGKISRELGYDRSLKKEDLPSGTVFYDIIMPESVPLTTLSMPLKSLWVTGFNFKTLYDMYRPREIAVIPTSLRYATIPTDNQDTTSVRCLSEENLIYACGDDIFMPAQPGTVMGDAVYTLKLRNSDAREYRDGLALRFRTLNGDTLMYLKPYKVPTSEIEAIEDVVIRPYNLD